MLLEVTGASWRPLGTLKLKSCFLFRGCTNDDIAYLEETLEQRCYNPNEVLMTTGGKADEMFVIVKGNVEVQILAEGGERKRIDVLTAGMTVGEMAFLDGSTRSADVIAMEPVRCVVITKDWFEALNAQRPSLKITLLHELTQELSVRLRQANREISTLHRG